MHRDPALPILFYRALTPAPDRSQQFRVRPRSMWLQVVSMGARGSSALGRAPRILFFRAWTPVPVRRPAPYEARARGVAKKPATPPALSQWRPAYPVSGPDHSRNCI